MSRRWSTSDVRWLRRLVAAGEPDVEIAGVFEVSVAAAKAARKRFGVRVRTAESYHVWTAAEKATLRRLYGTMEAADIAAQLGGGLTANKVWRQADRLGLNRPYATSDGLEEFVAARHAEGWTDPETAAAWGQRTGGRCERHRIHRVRDRLGLPPISGRVGCIGSRRWSARVRARTAEQLRASGVPTLGALRSKRFREYAAAAGWPADLKPRSVQILNFLATRPAGASKRGIADAIGCPQAGRESRDVLGSTDPEGSYLAHLAARGLVVRIAKGHRVVGRGKGRSCDLYLLGPEAERILNERRERRSRGEAKHPDAAAGP